MQLNFDCFWRELQKLQSIKENKKEFTKFFVAIVKHFKPILDKKNNYHFVITACFCFFFMLCPAYAVFLHGPGRYTALRNKSTSPFEVFVLMRPRRPQFSCKLISLSRCLCASVSLHTCAGKKRKGKHKEFAKYQQNSLSIIDCSNWFLQFRKLHTVENEKGSFVFCLLDFGCVHCIISVLYL